jgi:sulfur relay (sulfurtransferase) complex TusBCD TusD component (DsrE family)
MSFHDKKLGLLLSASLEQPGFQNCLKLAAAALDEGAAVFLYCVDEGVRAVDEPLLQSLTARGLQLYVCAYGAQRRKLQRNPNAIYTGLALLSDLMAASDRFVSFN